MSFLFGSPKVSPPPLPLMPPSPTDAEAKAAAAEEGERRRRAAALAKGRATSILTSGQGVTEAPPLRKKQLFGE